MDIPRTLCRLPLSFVLALLFGAPWVVASHAQLPAALRRDPVALNDAWHFPEGWQAQASVRSGDPVALNDGRHFPAQTRPNQATLQP